MAVQQFQPAIGHLVSQQAAGEADLLVQSQQGGTLQVGVSAEVPFVGDQGGYLSRFIPRRRDRIATERYIPVFSIEKDRNGTPTVTRWRSSSIA